MGILHVDLAVVLALALLATLHLPQLWLAPQTATNVSRFSKAAARGQ